MSSPTRSNEGMGMGHGVIAAAQAGDQRAFIVIVDAYETRLRAVVHRIVLDRDRLDDVMQEVFLRAFRGLPRWRGRGDLGTWLHRIAVNAGIDEVNRQARQRTTELVGEASDPTTVRQFDEVDQASSLRRLLSCLSSDQRAAIVLVDVEGLNYETAGEVLGVSAGTVSSRVSRARLVLRDRLKRSAEEPSR